MAAFDSSLLVSSPFEESTVSALEGYVRAQASGGAEYDFAANKGLVKAYNVLGSSVEANMDMMATVLAMSLMRLPSTHFLQLSYLIPGKHSGDSKIATLIKCADMLERAQFQEFWNEAKNESVTSVLSGIKNFEESVRGFVLNVVSKTFKNIDKATLCANLGLAGNNADALLKASDLVVTSSVGSNMIEFVQAATSEVKGIKKDNEIVSKIGELSKVLASS
jgi:hypothetical protein